MATLLIDSSSSTCLECGMGADPREEYHTTRLGYGEHDGKGCGVEFTKLVSGSYDKELEEAVKEMRPDLKYSGIFNPYAAPEIIKEYYETS